MRLLHRNELDFIGLDIRTINLSKRYFESGAIQLLHIEEVEDPYGVYHDVSAVLEVHGHLNECSFRINDYMEIENEQCDCPWGSYGICAHIGAVIHMISLMTFDAFPYHYQKTTSTLQKYLLDKEEKRKEAELLRQKVIMKRRKNESRKMIDQFQRSYQERLKFIVKKESYHLIPNFIFDEDRLLIGFQIARNKPYIIKNLCTFIDNLDNHETVRYGKFLEVYHDINSFDELSKKWIELIKTEHRPQTSLYYTRMYEGYYDSNRYLKIDNENVHKFFDLFKDEKEIDLTFLEEEFTYPIKISENEYSYIISKQDSLDLIEGNDAYYLISYDQIVRYPVENYSNLKEFISAISLEPLYVDKDDFTSFEHYVLSPNKKYLDIKDEREKKLVSVFIPKSFKVYGDLFDDDTVVFHAVGIDENQEVEIIKNDHFQPSLQSDLIKTILENEADYIEEHKAYFNLDRPETFELILEGTKILSQYCEVFVSEELKKLGKSTKYNLHVGVSFENDLLEVNLESEDFDVNEVDAILKAYHKKKKYFRLKSGLMIHLESNELDELDSFMQEYGLKSKDFHDGKLVMDNYRALSLDKRLDQMNFIKITKDDSLSQYIKGFENMSNQVEIDDQYNDVLRPYQKVGTRWLLTLYSYNLNGILADEMGLGKTLQVIAMLDSIRDKNKTSLVVCPASLIYNWEDEIAKFSKTLNCISITGAKAKRTLGIQNYRDYDLLITSYDYLRRDVDLYQDHGFECIILDEAQNIKNQKTKNAQFVKRLKANHRIALSGTPIENSLAELWSIFDFLMPGYLYSYHYFKQEYEIPITLDEDEKTTKRLRNLVNPFILRRTKKEVLKELPDKVDHKYMLEFSVSEKKLYLANLAMVNKEMQAKMKEVHFDRIAILAMLTKLRQICCDARLVYDNIKEPSTKINATISLIKTLTENDKKILLFSAFTSLLDLVSNQLDKEQISYYMLTGSTNKEERRKLVNNFNEDDTRVFLISLKAGGTGLNLTSAEAVIHIDPWWNLSAQNQATDRAHRIGQNANVQVYRMIMKDSIEEKILKMQERKANLADSFVEGNDGSLSKMSKEEILDLFKR